MKSERFDKGSKKLGNAGYWLAGITVALLLICPVASRAQEEMAGEWEIHTKNGIERKPRSQPLRVDIGPGTIVDIPSAVIGIGKGRLAADIEIATSEGPGGRPASAGFEGGVFAMVEDQKGQLWVGTKIGLCRFDGQTWTNYTTEDGLAGNWILDVGVDTQGDLWAVGEVGISRFNGQKWTRYLIKGKNGGSDLSMSSHGEVWFAADGNLYHFNGTSWWVYDRSDGIPAPGAVTWVEVDKHNIVWIGVESPEAPFAPYEIASFDGQQWVGYDLPTGTWHEFMNMVFADSQNRIWIGGSSGLFILEGTRARYYTEPADRWAQVSHVFEDEKGRFWLNTIGGELGYWEGTNWTFFAREEKPVDLHSYSSLLIDHKGNLWVGSTFANRLLKWDRAVDYPTRVEETTPLPKQFNLFQNYPNPFNAQTQMAFEVGIQQDVALRIFEVSGQLVTTLIQGQYKPGIYHTTWDGRDAQGHRVASGLYLYQLCAETQQITQKLMLIR
ncbi:MAG: T9SS type A sorting domain-containing protein [Chloroflexi bacterium]|nr:T9SS type A sorting domain-containing protein [Chloroflexota bacterium]